MLSLSSSAAVSSTSDSRKQHHQYDPNEAVKEVLK
jgi:hypothetical protein